MRHKFWSGARIGTPADPACRGVLWVSAASNDSFEECL